MTCRAYNLMEETDSQIVLILYSFVFFFQLVSCSCDKEWYSTRVQEDITDQAMLYLLLKKVSGSNVSLEDFGGTRSHERDRSRVWDAEP